MKSLLVFVALVGSSVLFLGCPNCNCPEAIPFTRWTDFILRPDQAWYPADADSLNFTLEVTEIEYLAQTAEPGYGSDAAMACSCIENGWRGFKSPLDSIRFTTVDDWDVNHAAGSSLNDITQVFDLNHTGLGPAMWANFDDPGAISGDAYSYFYTFRFTEGPTDPGAYDVVATLFYANGTSVEGESMTMVIQ